MTIAPVFVKITMNLPKTFMARLEYKSSFFATVGKPLSGGVAGDRGGAEKRNSSTDWAVLF